MKKESFKDNSEKRKYTDRQKPSANKGSGASERRPGAEKRPYSKDNEGYSARKNPSDRYSSRSDSKPFSKSTEKTGNEKPYAKRNDSKSDKRSSLRDEGQYGYRKNPSNRYEKPKRPRIVKGQNQSKNISGETRLNKYISNSGICSRREADELIRTGLISVNGEIVTEMGVKVKPGDEVKYNGEKIRSEKKVYLLLNKPRDYVTTMHDPEGRRTVLELIKEATPERVYPVGRLDRNTTGVLLFTNDGELATRLIHPKYEKKKIYHVFLDSKMSKTDLEKIANGLTLEDGFIKPDSVEFASESKDEVGIEIHSGKKHIVRRIFEHLEYKVVKLDRVYFAGLTKKNLPRGKYRFLSEKEINMLKMSAFE
jgi:23S rRNA pseudouridine2605 synthase